MKCPTAVYPGSFDPPTNGHVDIVYRATQLFPKVIVAVTNNSVKDTAFSLNERIKMLKDATRGLQKVEVVSFEGLLVNYLKKRKASVIIRGLRAISDFEYEFQMALMNRKLDANIETVFLMPDEANTYLSSSLVKEVARLGGSVKGFVPIFVEKNLKKINSNR
ncbi:MAG: pantetheine-phosphate adenylyltransferase [Elusimicrobia bacterium]|nr:pantetheine-phosphate adenylyltransferase [Elusimicrobiota bacterium]